MTYNEKQIVEDRRMMSKYGKLVIWIEEKEFTVSISIVDIFSGYGKLWSKAVVLYNFHEI